jgi:hypothetical protein
MKAMEKGNVEGSDIYARNTIRLRDRSHEMMCSAARARCSLTTRLCIVMENSVSTGLEGVPGAHRSIHVCGGVLIMLSLSGII